MRSRHVLLAGCRYGLVAVLLAGGATLAACRQEPARSAAGPMRVSAAVSLTDVLTDVGKRWEGDGRGHLELNFAASNVLARQIVEGAPVDVFISADDVQMDRVISGGEAQASDVVPLFTNQLVIITPVGRSLPGQGPASLADVGVKRVAIGDPQGVPAGVYAKEWLERAGVWRRVEPKIVPAGSVRAALAAVEAGNADAGIVYRTDAKGDRKVSIAYEVPLPDAPPIVYPGVVLKRSTHRDAARQFIEFLQSAPAREAISAAGFIAPDSAATR